MRVDAPRRRFLPFLALALASGACQRQRPAPVVAMEPRPNPPAHRPADTPRERLRQNRWLARHWEELTPAQRRRVEQRMRRAQPSAASDRDGAQSVWDTLGLAERDQLVFGRAAPIRPAATAASGVEASPPPTP